MFAVSAACATPVKPNFGQVVRLNQPRVKFAPPPRQPGQPPVPSLEDAGGILKTLGKIVGVVLAPIKAILNLVTSLPVLSTVARLFNNLLAKVGLTTEKEKGEKLF